MAAFHISPKWTKLFGIGPGVFAQGGIEYLLRDEFTTTESAPLASPRTCEPGPGALTLVQNDGQFSISGGKLQIPLGTITVLKDIGYFSTGLSRSCGLLLNQQLNLANIGAYLYFGFNISQQVGWWNDQNANGWYFSGYGGFNAIYSNVGTVVNHSVVANTEYQFALVLRTTGAWWFIKGGAYTDWTLWWAVNINSAATVYPALSNGNAQGTQDHIRVRQLPAPFDTDYGIAALDVTAFTQSLGAELLTNGDFSAWTGDNPDGWTVTGEVGADPEVTERDPNQGHADTKTVGGAANFYASAASNNPVIAQNVAVAGLWYEYYALLSYVKAGNFVVARYGGQEIINMHRIVHRASGTYVGLRSHSGGTAPDFTCDSITYKRITLNAQQVMPANAILDFTYALPASPVAGSRIMMLYRISDASLEAGYNCWQAYLRRNSANTAWDFSLDSVNAGKVTNRINVTGVGSPTTIRVICDGTKHNCYTLEGTTWTKRGSEVDVSWNDSATGLNTIYDSGVTPSRLTVWPRTAAAYAELDKV